MTTMKQWFLAGLLGLMALGCGSESPGSDTDNGTATEEPTDTNDAPPPGVVLGQVEISISGWGGQWSTDANVRADFYDSPVRMEAFSPFPPGLHEIALEQGGCVLWLPAQGGQCNPPCDWDEYCGAQGSCVLMPARVSAGDITITAGTENLVIHPSDWGYDGGSLPKSALGPGSTITAVALGGAIEAFKLSATGFATPEFDLDESNTLTLADGKDNTITFKPLDEGMVRLLVNKGWHGSLPEATLMCEVAASEGELVIPQALVEAFPSSTGVGLEQHQSWIALISRDQKELTGGPVELVVAYKHNLNPVHGE